MAGGKRVPVVVLMDFEILAAINAACQGSGRTIGTVLEQLVTRGVQDGLHRQGTARRRDHSDR